MTVAVAAEATATDTIVGVSAALGVITVWVANVNSVTDAGRHCSAAEFASAAGRRSGQRWLASRTVLRSVLGSALDIDPADVTFELAPSGKPHLTREELHFSLSHSADLVAVAVSKDGAVGVDVEAPRMLRRPDRLARRLFTSGEYDRWTEQLDPARTHLLLQHWTRTEALLKATGEGLRAGMRGAVERHCTGGWTVRDLVLASGVGAVASRGHAWDVKVRRWRSAECVEREVTTSG
ncbi:MAG: hypothetical protein NVS3B12_16100 [Acidimicrobiales bacterium]